MFDEYFLEFDLDIKKANHIFETAYNKLDIYAMELYTLESSGMLGCDEDPDEMFKEGVGSFVVNGIKAFFTKLKEAIKKLYINIKDKIENIIRKREMKKKLKNIKQAVATKSIRTGKKNGHTDIAKLYKAYAEFSKEYVKAFRTVYGKTYDNIDQYNDAIAKVDEMLEAKFNALGLDDDDKYTIQTSVLDHISMTDKETDNMAKITDMIVKQMQENTVQFETMAVNEDDASKISGIKSNASDLNSKLSSGLNKIVNGWNNNCKTVITAATAILGTAAIAGGAVYLANKQNKTLKPVNANSAQDAVNNAANAVKDAIDLSKMADGSFGVQ